MNRMIRGWRLPAALASALIATQVQGAIFFGADRRAPTTEPFAQAILPIHAGLRTATAFLVDRCFAVTAQHVVVTREHRFLLARVRMDGEWIATEAVLRGGGPFKARTNDDYAGDWILLKLNRCASPDHPIIPLTPIAFNNPSELPRGDGEVLTFGFPTDRAGLVGERQCLVHAVRNGTWLTSCAAWPGDSGSPVMVRTPSGRVEAIGVMVAGDRKRYDGFTLSSANVAASAAPIALALVAARIQIRSHYSESQESAKNDLRCAAVRRECRRLVLRRAS